jgi:O-antigen ligase
MNDTSPGWPGKSLQISFALFVIASTFSIALAQLSLGVSVFLFILVAIREQHNPFAGPAKLLYLFIALYLGWLLLAAALGKTPVQSLLMCKEEWLFAAIPIGIYLFRKMLYREKLLFAFGIAVGIVAFYAISQFFTGTHWLHFTHGAFEANEVPKPVGNFTHWLTFANFYAAAGTFLFGYLVFDSSLERRRYWTILVFSLLAMLAVVLTSSRTPIAAILISLVFCATIRAGKARLIPLALLVGLGLVAVLLPSSREKFGSMLERDTSSEYEGSRVFIWTRSWDIVKEHPLFGVGQGNFKAEYVARLDPNVEERRKHAHAHNDFLNIAAIAGIPGALFFAGVWVVVLRLVGKAAFDLRLTIEQRRFALAALVGSVVFLLTSLTEATFADEEVRQMLMFLWAVGLSVRYNDSL